MVIWQTIEIFITSDLFGPQWKEGTTEWKTFHNDELRQTKFRAPNQTGGNGERNTLYWGGKGNEYTVVVGKTEGNRRLERPRQRWKYNIKMNFKQIGWDGVCWIHVA